MAHLKFLISKLPVISAKDNETWQREKAINSVSDYEIYSEIIHEDIEKINI